MKKVDPSITVGSVLPGRAPSDDAGNRATITALYDQHGALAFSLAYRIVRDWGVAEEVVQDAFLAVWRNIHRYDPKRGSARAWLCQIVRNRAVDRLRGTSGRARDHQSLEDFALLSGSPDVVEEVLRRDQRGEVLAALAALPAGQREAIELAYFGGYSQSEIATNSGLPLGTVKGRTRAAMRALARSLAPLRTSEVAIGAPTAGFGDWMGGVSPA